MPLIIKFNPYHDHLGRFASSGSSTADAPPSPGQRTVGDWLSSNAHEVAPDVDIPRNQEIHGFLDRNGGVWDLGDTMHSYALRDIAHFTGRSYDDFKPFATAARAGLQRINLTNDDLNVTLVTRPNDSQWSAIHRFARERASVHWAIQQGRGASGTGLPSLREAAGQLWPDTVQKFNPYHDELGRFASGDGGASSISPPAPGAVPDRETFYQTAIRNGKPPIPPGQDAWNVQPYSRIDEGKKFDALPDHTPVWVFHGTERETAQAFLKNGIDEAGKPWNLARERYDAGQVAEFAPGRGVSSGTYVAGSPQGASGFGPALLAIRVPKGRVEASPEQKALGVTSPGWSLAEDDAVVHGRIPASSVVLLDDSGRYPKDAYTELLGAGALGSPVVKFNPYHDEHGRFSSANGSGAGSAPPTPSVETRPHIDNDLLSRGRDLLYEGLDGGQYADDVRSATKAGIQRTLGKRLYGDPGAKDAYKAVFGHAPTRDDMEHEANRVVHQWTRSSADKRADSLAIQMAAAQEFGTSAAGISELKARTPPDAWSAGQAAQQDHGPMDRAVLRAMYDETQAHFRAAGIKDVTIMRGMAVPERQAPDWIKTLRPGESATGPVQMQPLSAFSAAENDPAMYARIRPAFLNGQQVPSIGVVVGLTVPVSRVIGTARTGFGSLPEAEMVLLDTPGTATVKRVEGRYEKRAPAPVVKFNPHHDAKGRFASGSTDNTSEPPEPPKPDTTAQASAWATHHIIYGGPNAIADYSKTDATVAHAMNTAIARALDEYHINGPPAIMSTQDYRKQRGQPGSGARQILTTWGYSAEQGGRTTAMTYDATMAKNAKTLEKNLAYNRTQGYTTIQDIDGAMVHETGHLVARNAPNGRAVEQSVLQEADARIKDGRLTKQQTHDLIGDYGTSSGGEFFAEVYRLHKTSGLPEPLAWAGPLINNLRPGDAIAKFNPYHDEKGRFTTGDGAAGGAAPPAPVKLNVVLSPNDIKVPDEAEVRWVGSNSPWMTVNDRPGEMLQGAPAKVSDLPETLYHVSPHVKEIKESGVLLARTGADQGGLGGRRREAVSFTTSKDDARVIQQEIRRAIELANVTDGKDVFSKYARLDAGPSAESRAKMQAAADDAQHWLDHSNKPHEDYKVPGKMIQPDVGDLALQAYNQYLWTRQSAGGDLNPILVGDSGSWKRFKPEDVGIISVPRANLFESGALVRHHLDAKDFLHEVAVHGDVPIGPQPVEKFNPYHDERGRFATGDSASAGTGDNAPPAPLTAQNIIDEAFGKVSRGSLGDPPSSRVTLRNWDKINSKLAITVARQFATLAHAWPPAAKAITEINVAGIPARDGGGQPYASTSTTDGVITLQRGAFAHPKKLADMVYSDHADGFLAGSTPESLVTHEFGHMVQKVLFGEPRGLFDPIRAPQRALDAAWGAPTPEKAQSDYAKQNPYERFAEAFTALNHVRPERWKPDTVALDRVFQGPKPATKSTTRQIVRFNPYHDEHGRFTTSDGASAGGKAHNAPPEPAAKPEGEHAIPMRLDGVDKALVPQISSVMADLSKAYPAVAERLRAAGGLSVAKPRGIQEEAWASTSPEGAIELNPARWSNAAKLTASMAASEQKGWIVGSKPEDALTHEFGHVLHQYMRGDDRFKDAVADWARTDPAKHVSDYAQESTDERFAENFTAMQRVPQDKWVEDTRNLAHVIRGERFPGQPKPVPPQWAVSQAPPETSPDYYDWWDRRRAAGVPNPPPTTS